MSLPWANFLETLLGSATPKERKAYIERKIAEEHPTWPKSRVGSAASRQMQEESNA